MENVNLDQEIKIVLKKVKEDINGRMNYYTRMYDNIKNLSDHDLNEIYKSYMTLKNDDFSCVYFIRNKYTGYVKIGCTKQLETRLTRLNSLFENYFGMKNALSIEAVIYVPSKKHMKLESEIHQDLIDKHIFGEWYDISFDDIKINYIPDGKYFDNILVGYVVEDIPNDGFNVIHIKSLDNEIAIIKRSIAKEYFSRVLPCNLTEENQRELSLLENVINNTLHMNYKYEDYDSVLGCLSESTKIFDMFEDLLKNNICISVPEYNFDNKINCYVKKIHSIGALNGKLYTYDDIINNKIESYFGIANG